MAEPMEPLGPQDYQAWVDWRREQEREYNQWEATQAIYHDGVLAYDTGHRVPASNVERHGYDRDGLVRRVEQPAKATEKKGKAPDA